MATNRMNVGLLAAVSITLLTAQPGSDVQAQDRGQRKSMPRGASTVNDSDGDGVGVRVSPNRPGKATWMLKVNGWFDDEGLNLTDISRDSPVLNLRGRADSRSYRLERGDVIARIDGQDVTSPRKYREALDEADNPRNLKLRVIDWRTGATSTFFASAIKRQSRR